MALAAVSCIHVTLLAGGAAGEANESWAAERLAVTRHRRRDESTTVCGLLDFKTSSFTAGTAYADVCAASKVLNRACAPAMSYDDASALCTQLAAHGSSPLLCTPEELLNDAARETGCELDNT